MTETNARASDVTRPPVAGGPDVESVSNGPQFAGLAPRAVLQRIVTGDPLRLRARIGLRLRERFLFCDADRVHLRALARCARFASAAPERGALGTWLVQQVDESIDAIVREDAELGGGPDDRGGAFVDLARPLGLDPGAVRRVCIELNQLDEVARRSFVQRVLEGAAPTDSATLSSELIERFVDILDGARR